MFPKKINILGARWRIKIRKYEDDQGLQDRELAGYCGSHKREIVIRDLREEEDEIVAVSAMKHVLRHEVLHAFFKESGLWYETMGTDAWSMNEEMIDWFSTQAPKIFKVYQECNAI